MEFTKPRARSLLQQSVWFSTLPAALQSALLDRAEILALQTGQALFRRGDPACGLYAVLAGTLSIGAVDVQGREALLTIVEPPAWFGEIGVFDGLPRTHDVTALSAVALLHIPQAALRQLLAAEPHYWQELGLLLSQKLRLAFLNVEALSTLPAVQRLAGRLLMIAEGYGDASQRRRVVRLSQERLAALLSLTRQTTNQLLQALAAQGLVRLRFGAIELVDTARLQALARGGPERSSPDR